MNLNTDFNLNNSFMIITNNTLKNYLYDKSLEFDEVLSELNSNKIFPPKRKKLLEIQKRLKDLNFTVEIIKERANNGADSSLIIKIDKLDFLIYQIYQRLKYYGVN